MGECGLHPPYGGWANRKGGAPHHVSGIRPLRPVPRSRRGTPKSSQADRLDIRRLTVAPHQMCADARARRDRPADIHATPRLPPLGHRPWRKAAPSGDARIGELQTDPEVFDRVAGSSGQIVDPVRASQKSKIACCIRIGPRPSTSEAPIDFGPIQRHEVTSTATSRGCLIVSRRRCLRSACRLGHAEDLGHRPCGRVGLGPLHRAGASVIQHAKCAPLPAHETSAS